MRRSSTGSRYTAPAGRLLTTPIRPPRSGRACPPSPGMTPTRWRRFSVAGATSNKRVLLLAPVAAALVWSSSCSTPARHGAGSPMAPSASILPRGHAIRVCFGTPPRAWATALRARVVTTPGGVRFGLGALSGSTAFGQFNSVRSNGIGKLDLATGRLTTIHSYGPGVSGSGWMAADPPWVVWEQLDSQTNPLDWSIHAWNESTGATTLLAAATRQRDGSYPPGQQPLPVISHGTAAWAQPAPAPAGGVNAQIRVMTLATRRFSILDSGRVSSPVYAGPYLIWGKIAGGAYTFQAANAHTLKPVLVPAPLHHPGSIGYLGGSPQYLVWSNLDGTVLNSWRIGSPRYSRFLSPDNLHHFQFLQVSGHFVLWFSGAVSSVLDLTTGKAFDVQGTVTGSSERIAAAEPVSQPAAK